MANKRFIQVLTAIATSLILASESPAESTTPSGGSSSTEDRAILHLVRQPCDRKRMPSNDYIEISYFRGNVSVTAVEEKSIFNIEIKNNESLSIETLSLVPNDTPVYCPLDSGFYTVVATEDNGKIYCGDLEITSTY